VSLKGRDLLCKLRAHITFDSDGTAALKLRGPEAKTLILMVAQEEEWQLYAPEGRPPEILSFSSRFQLCGLKITPRSILKCAPNNCGTKAGIYPY
jgi:hypothetical protein